MAILPRNPESMPGTTSPDMGVSRTPDRSSRTPEARGDRRKKKKPSKEDQDAERIRAALDAARERAAATGGTGAEAQGGSTATRDGARIVDADAMPDGELVKLSDDERAKFEKSNLLAYTGVAAGAAALGYLGYATGMAVTAAKWYAVWKAFPFVADGLGRLADRMSDRLLKKKMPRIVKWIVHPLAGAMDKTAKWMGLDKTLYTHLKKNREDRKKLAEKLLKELRASESAHEKKVDAKAKSKKDKSERDSKRYARLKAKYGAEVAHSMVYEMWELEEEEDRENADAPEEPTPAVVA